jgi:hypothetical protein
MARLTRIRTSPGPEATEFEFDDLEPADAAGSPGAEAEVESKTGSDAEVDADEGKSEVEADAGAEVEADTDIEPDAGADSRSEDSDGGSGSGGGRGRPVQGGHTGGWRQRQVIIPALVAVVSLSIAAVLIVAGRSDRGSDDGGPLPTMPPTTMDTGGIDVPTPDGWTAAPVPDLGFGIAVPPGWEAVVLSDEMLNSLSRSDPAVTGFIEAAHAAAQGGAVFYAAGEDGQGRVTDLKLRADTRSGVADSAGLEEYARGHANQPGLADTTVEPVEGAELPTVRIGFRTTSESEDGERISARGVETVVLGPGDAVWSVIIISEDPAMIDDLAPRILDTLTLAEPD